MTATVIVACLVGAALAQRFRFLILIPLLILIACAVIVAIFVLGEAAWNPILTGLFAAAGLQIGYLVGAVFHTWDTSRNRQADPSAATDKSKPNSNVLPVH